MSDKAKQEAQAQADAVALKEGDHNPYAHGLLQQASDLDAEKAALLKRIGANRDALRGCLNTGMVSKEQAAAIEEFYPKRGSKDDAAAAAPAGN